jgi:DNA modification methylase
VLVFNSKAVVERRGFRPKIFDESVDLICTSPPFALVRKKEYGNVDADDYVDWFKIFAGEFYRKERVGLN